MKHYWINMDKSTDRRELMEKQFLEKGIDNTRICAETPETTKHWTIHRHPDSTESQGEISCLISHIKAVKQGYDDGYECFCVVEDDMIIKLLNFERIFKHLKEAEEKHGKPYDVLQLFTNSHPFIVSMYNNNIEVPGVYQEYIQFRDNNLPSAGYYMVSRTGAKKILDKFVVSSTEFDLSFSSWCVADNYIYQPFSSYILTYPIAIADTSYESTLHISHKANHDHANRFIEKIWSISNELSYLTLDKL